MRVGLAQITNNQFHSYTVIMLASKLFLKLRRALKYYGIILGISQRLVTFETFDQSDEAK